ncbi:MAG: UDP-N-acetylmuramoyl-L-alanine--D-glutamate ligase [Acidimicrobiia bacterium]|nr:UDP-N-acetylmuramoyl-L-alanine--D-glutamate ligase [Acidimicrobiia bacterium]
MTTLPLDRPLVVGLGVTGGAVVDALLRRGHRPVVADDHPSDAALRRADSSGVTLVAAPDGHRWATLVDEATIVLPSPGVPDRHPAMRLARSQDVLVASEFDLAAEWDDRPVAAVTGTDGKTTVTTLVAAMLEASGRQAAMAGNTDVPLVAAIEDPTVEVFVVEASSFRLGHSCRFAPSVATWLNLAADHLDVHDSFDGYVDAKAAIWAHLGADAVAVANADDPVVMRHVRRDRPLVTFGLDARPRPDHWTVLDDTLVGPGPVELMNVSRLRRRHPHDLLNALAASATTLAAGGTRQGVVDALEAFDGLAHRVSPVAERQGVRFYDDSKATTPHAVVAAVAGFDSVVLIAGGRNKGLDLTPMAACAERCRAVVLLGEAAGELADVFEGLTAVHRAEDMADAVRQAAGLARAGDAVVLSPGCASFDSYRSYAERGDDFATKVQALDHEQSVAPSDRPSTDQSTR